MGEAFSYEERAKTIFGERADLYTTSAAHTDEHVLGRLVEIAQPQADWRVLDIGTGTGHTALALAPHVREVVGLDLTAEMLVEARRLATEKDIDNVSFEVGDVHQLPPGFYGAFDLVTCRRAAHHFSNINGALQEMVRALRTGGVLLIDDRSVPEDDWVDETMHRLDCLHDESHVRQYRPSCWIELLEEAELSVETVEPYTKQRSINALTARVSANNVDKIHTIFDHLTTQQKTMLGVQDKEGERCSTHWYLMISARKA